MYHNRAVQIQATNSQYHCYKYQCFKEVFTDNYEEINGTLKETLQETCRGFLYRISIISCPVSAGLVQVCSLIRACLQCHNLKRQQCMYKRSIDAHSLKHCCRGKAISITYSECVSVALVIQHAKHIHRIIFVICGLPALPYLLTESQKWRVI